MTRPRPTPARPAGAGPEPRGGSAPEARRWRALVTAALVENVGTKFLAAVLAVTVFLLVGSDRDGEITARVGVSYTLPDDRVLVSERLDEVRVTIRGPWRRLRRFDQRELEHLSLDLRNTPGGEVPLAPDLVHVPAGLRVASISPRAVRVAFERRVAKVVEVVPSVVGRPVHGYVATEVKASPTTVTVRGAASVLGALTAVRTLQVSLEGRADSFTAATALAPPEGVELDARAAVDVSVHVQEELVTRRVGEVAVAVAGEGAEPGRWRPTPARVELTLTGALLEVEKAIAADVRPVARPPADPARPGLAREAELVVEGLPPGVGVRLSPPRVRLAPRGR